MIRVWFYRAWWCYLLSPRGRDESNWWTVLRCRMTGHICGPVWYNAGGTEPDMHCKNCGDDLG